MKTIATAAVLMMLSAPAWADDAEKQTNDPANTNEPMVLSEAEMDGVTAGTETGRIRLQFHWDREGETQTDDTSMTLNFEKFKTTFWEYGK